MEIICRTSSLNRWCYWTLWTFIVFVVLDVMLGGNAEMITETEPNMELSRDFFKKLGDTCTQDIECEGIRDGTCDETSRHCVCKESHPVSEMGNMCFEPSKLNHTCEVDSQCEYLNRNSYCAKPKRVCQCRERHPQIVSLNGTAYCFIDRRELADAEVDYTMMGVLAGMALMFVIMCIVLRMFSKARFQENRTIFNDPQMLKGSLARKHRERTESEREKRGSRASSKAPSRQPSVYSGLNVPVKSPTNSQGSGKSHGNDSRHSSFGTDQVIVDIKGGHNMSSPKTNRV